MADAPSVRRRADPGGIPCPDRNLVAGLAEDRLLPEERRSVEAHMEACAPCRERVAAVRASLAPVAPASAVGAGRPRLLAAAAVLLAAAGLSLSWWRPWGDGAPAPEGDAALLAAAEALGRERPDLLRGFRPLDRAERTARPGLLRGNGGGPRSPAGRLLDPRPPFRWEVPPGVEAWRFRLFRQGDGAVLVEADCPGPPFLLPAVAPRLEEGVDYLWEAAAEGPLGREEIRTTFSVAAQAECRALAAAAEAIDRSAPPGTAAVLKAHVAIRRGFFQEAERILREEAGGGAGDAAARETLDLLRETLGPPGSGTPGGGGGGGGR